MLTPDEVEVKVKEVRAFIVAQEEHVKLQEIAYYLSLQAMSEERAERSPDVADRRRRLVALQNTLQNRLIRTVTEKYPDMYRDYPTLLKILMFNYENSHIVDMMLERIRRINADPSIREEVATEMGQILAEQCIPPELRNGGSS